ncbi:hypothetical protein BCR43DRAFT_516747 [Syncephalastrum racemosum]|uniref:UBX domain-containing protein n=1 Tax=Syncephalastrum racemosum TaxID=13706 RepID=A0A1X2H5J6_SYNRA|nr:hypothetical protein BCR43DRAFT_516747 [Syncephalastrum racemosum]
MSECIWFKGPVAEAVTRVNEANCILTVFLHGKSDRRHKVTHLIQHTDDSSNSQTLEQKLLDSEMIPRLASSAVTLKMHTESNDAKLFTQLYPVYHIPIVYFIRQGTIKDFVTHEVTVSDLIAKLDALAGRSTTASPNSVDLLSSGSSNTATNQATQPFETTRAEPSPSSDCLSSSSSSSSSAQSPSAVEQERKEKLRNQMELARKKREEREKQTEKDQEKKRRENGKEIQKVSRDAEDNRNKEYAAQLKKEKQATEEHRKRIREQIAQDRAERAAARSTEINRSPHRDPSSEPKKKSHTVPETSNISIRQLDGLTLRNKFSSTATLGHVKDWIDQNRRDGDQPYRLISQFPTRHFTVGDEGKPLRDLHLYPSATIIMKGMKNVSAAYPTGSTGMLGYVYAAGGSVYGAVGAVGSAVSNAVWSFLSPAQPAPAGPHSSDHLGASYYGAGGGRRLGGDSPLGASTSGNVNTLRTTEFEEGSSDSERGGMYNGNSLNQE